MNQKQKDVAKFYKRKQVESATPGQLVVLLYEGAIDNLKKAEIVYQESGAEKIEKFHNYVIACQNIVTELMVSLDMERGGDIAKNLLRLYDYMIYRLVDSNMSKDLEGIKEVRELLTNLKTAWDDVVENEPKVESLPKKNVGLNLKG